MNVYSGAIQTKYYAMNYFVNQPNVRKKDSMEELIRVSLIIIFLSDMNKISQFK